MIAVTLQKLLKASFPFSIVAKCCGILYDSCYAKKLLEASLSFSVVTKSRDSLSKKNVWFRTQGELFSYLFSLELNDANRVKIVRLGFETKQI